MGTKEQRANSNAISWPMSDNCGVDGLKFTTSVSIVIESPRTLSWIDASAQRGLHKRMAIKAAKDSQICWPSGEPMAHPNCATSKSLMASEKNSSHLPSTTRMPAKPQGDASMTSSMAPCLAK